jgi:hypothetical protein
MKKIVLGAVLLAGALLGYRWFQGWRAYKAYQAFADSWARGNRIAAAEHGDEGAVRYAFEKKPIRGTRGGAAMEAFRGTLYAVGSKTRNDDGDVELFVTQTVLFDPPGMTTALGGAMFARFHEAATVRDTPDGWRVVAFEPTFVEMGPLRRGR